MVRTVKDLKEALIGVPEEIEVGFCSFDGGHMFEIGPWHVEDVDDGASKMFVLYTKPGEQAVLLKIKE